MQRGFTLIELLVVISIIGILTSIVLVPLNNSRNRARNASAKTTMSDIRVYADVFHSNNGYSYDNGVNEVCSDAEIVRLRTAVANQTGNATACGSSSSAYAVWVKLHFNTHFCVDSRSFSGEIPADLPAGSTVCQ